MSTMVEKPGFGQRYAVGPTCFVTNVRYFAIRLLLPTVIIIQRFIITGTSKADWKRKLLLRMSLIVFV